MYADDIVLLSTSATVLQELLYSVSSNGSALQWVDSIRYLGIYMVNARQFKCRYDYVTASFYRAFNAVFLVK